VRVLITGTREDGPHCSAVADAVLALWLDGADDGFLTVVHGDCPTGIDAEAERICEERGIPSERYPADWDTHGKSAGPRRNKQMVDLGADLCLAFPKGVSRGTRGCLALAKAAGIKTLVVEL
jgi:hypothetical protein